MTYYEIARRYPRLLHAMQWVACLSDGEAIACIRDFKAGYAYSGEAVNHFGGTDVVIHRAIKQRTRWLIADRRREETRRLVIAYEREHAVNQRLANRRGTPVRGVIPNGSTD